jgi:hypothetical protein
MEVPGSRGAHGAGQREIDRGNHGAQNLTKPHLGRTSVRNCDAASFSHIHSSTDPFQQLAMIERFCKKLIIATNFDDRSIGMRQG